MAIDESKLGTRPSGTLVALFAGVLGLIACAHAVAPPPTAPPSSDPFDGSSILAEPSIAVTAAMGSPHLGDAVPDFDLLDQNGKHVTLASVRGSVVVIAFVAAFCPFSKAEQPWLKQLAAEVAGKNVRVIAIDIREPEVDYREYLGRMPMGIPVLRDDGGAVAIRFAPAGAQPEIADRAMALATSNLIVDTKGKIRFFTVLDTVHFDPKLVHLHRALERVLAEPSS